MYFLGKRKSPAEAEPCKVILKLKDYLYNIISNYAMGRNRNNIVTQKAPVTDKATRA